MNPQFDMSNLPTETDVHISNDLINLLTHELPDADQQLFVQTILNEFTLFPSLPLELRLRVWKFTFPPPRTMIMTSNVVNYISDYDVLPGSPYIFTRFYAPPIAYGINHESHTEVLRHYNPACHDLKTNPLFSTSKNNLFCFKRDRLRIDEEFFVRILFPGQGSIFPTPTIEARIYVAAIQQMCAQIQKLEILCIGPAFWARDEHFKDFPNSRLKYFKSLREVNILILFRKDKSRPQSQTQNFSEQMIEKIKRFEKALKLYLERRKSADGGLVIPTFSLSVEECARSQIRMRN
ncbi:hypothetical protein B0J14DRAFT_196953 [Halenospora varia]|nr:hypothetical protein B0J14DRAFT_196953 [Halenospora varia]